MERHRGIKAEVEKGFDKKVNNLDSISTTCYQQMNEPISKRPLLSDICVPDERDLATGSNFNPRNTQCIPVVKIFIFLDIE